MRNAPLLSMAPRIELHGDLLQREIEEEEKQ